VQPAYLGITDNAWYNYLRQNRITDEVNFWIPSAPRARHVEPGTLWLFKLHAPLNVIAGGGVFMHYSVLPLQLAWDAFGNRNGVATLQDLCQSIQRYHGEEVNPWMTPVGCAILNQVTWLPRELWVPYQTGPLVSGKHMSAPGDQQVVQQVLRNLNMANGDPATLHEPPLYTPDYTPAYALREVRQGQATFRIEVLDAYHRQCAVSHEHSLPVLEAAHIAAWSDTHVNDVTNGILLRADIHKLFDAGYVTIDPNGYRFVVSRRLKEDYDNGKEYYQLHGSRILLPDDPTLWPDRTQLERRNDEAWQY